MVRSSRKWRPPFWCDRSRRSIGPAMNLFRRSAPVMAMSSTRATTPGCVAVSLSRGQPFERRLNTSKMA